MNSTKKIAKLAGLLYLLMGIPAAFSLMYIPSKLIVRGDATATATNILASQSLFRLGIVSVLISAVIFIFLALVLYRLFKGVNQQHASLLVILVLIQVPITFLNEVSSLAALILVRGADFLSLFEKAQRDYELFKPVNRSLSLLAAFFSLVAIAMQAFSSLFQLAPLVVLGGGSPLSAFTAAQLQALALMFLKLNAHAFDVYLVFFGFWCVLIGYLIFKSTFMPRIIGVLEAFAGLCWLTFLWLPLAHYLSPYNQALAGLGELSLMLWLLVMGVNDQRWKEQASAAGASIRT